MIVYHSPNIDPCDFDRSRLPVSIGRMSFITASLYFTALDAEPFSTLRLKPSTLMVRYWWLLRSK